VYHYINTPTICDDLNMTQESIIQLFSLNTSSGIPIYRQLIDQIKQAIRMKLLTEEQQLPSVRKLASSLQINPMTISKAFAQLEIEGVLNRKRGVGMLIAKPATNQLISLQVENSLNRFIQASQKELLDDETVMMLVQQALSVKKTS
jgi:GntR family transcriptional regulator